MKKALAIIAALAFLVAPAVQAQSVWATIGDTLTGFLNNNPKESWEVSAYGLNNVSQSALDISKGWGGGARIGYWLNPSVGAVLDASYCNSSWTFASLGLAARVTVPVSTVGSITPYVTAGPGLNLSGSANGASSTFVAVAGGGASIHINAIKAVDFFAEYSHVTTKEPQDRILFGVTHKF